MESVSGKKKQKYKTFELFIKKSCSRQEILWKLSIFMLAAKSS